MWISVCAYFGGLGGSIVHGVTVVDDMIYKIYKRGAGAATQQEVRWRVACGKKGLGWWFVGC